MNSIYLLFSGNVLVSLSVVLVFAFMNIGLQIVQAYNVESMNWNEIKRILDIYMSVIGLKIL